MFPTYTDLLPFRQYSEFDVLNAYSTDVTGVGGRFYSFLTGNNNPELSAGDFSAATPGYNFAGVTNVRYENKRKVTLTVSGATKYEVAGLALYGTIERDENDQKVLFHPERQTELNVLVSGQTSPIATAGVFRLKSTAYIGVPFPGYVGIAAGAGKVAFVPPTNTGLLHTYGLCKVLSTSGSKFGGYADIKLTLS